MISFLESSFEILDSLHRDCKRQIAGLTLEKLEWSPGKDMNSLAVLAAHIAGAERYWIGDVVMGEDSARVRDEEFTTAGVHEAELISRLDSSLDYVEEAFGRLTLDSLSEVRRPAGSDRDLSVTWSIVHVLQHTALHLGHMEITRQLLDAHPPD